MKSATVIPPGEGEKFWIVGDHITLKLGSAASNGRYVVAENWVADGGGPPPHLHHREDELFYVLDGEQEFLLGDATFRGGAGTAVYLPKDIIHTFRIVGGRPSRKLVIACPCGFERFVEEAGERIDRIPHPKVPAANDFQRLGELTPKFGLEIFPEHKPTRTAPVKPADRRLWVLGHLVTIKLTSADTNGNFSVAEGELRPGKGVPVHAHRAMDEMFYVLDGAARFQLDGQTVDATTGTFIHVPAGVWHGFATTSSARLLHFHTPGGFEEFFEEAGEPCTDPTASPPPFDGGRAASLFRKHGMELRAS